MYRSTASELLVRFVTTRDMAESIVGDLKEQAQDHGRIWYWYHLVGTTVSLAVNNALRSPARWLGLALAGTLLSILALTFIFVLWARGGLTPNLIGHLDPYDYWLAYSGAFFSVGFVLARYGSNHRLNGCAPFAALLVPFWLCVVAYFVYTRQAYLFSLATSDAMSLFWSDGTAEAIVREGVLNTLEYTAFILLITAPAILLGSGIGRRRQSLQSSDRPIA